MTQFIAHGPYPMTTTKKNAGREISKSDISKFWGMASLMIDCVGVYVFGIRAGGAISPFYVGRATKSFAQEVFSPDKLNKYHSGLREYRRGAPVWFFVCHPSTKKGKPSVSHIKALEKLLIQQCALVNPDLINVHHKALPKWGISGVVRSKTKKPSKSAKELRETVGLAG